MPTVAELKAQGEALKVEEQRLSEQMAKAEEAEREAKRVEEYMAKLAHAKAYWNGLHGAVAKAIGTTLSAKGFGVCTPDFTPSDNYYGGPDGDTVNYRGSGATSGMRISFGWVRINTSPRSWDRRSSYTSKITLSLPGRGNHDRRYKLTIVGSEGRLEGMPTAVTGNFKLLFKAINEKLQAVAAAEQQVTDEAKAREARRQQIEQDLGTPCTLKANQRVHYDCGRGGPKFYTDHTYAVAADKLTVNRTTDGKYNVGIKTEPLTVEQVKAIMAIVNG